MGDAGQASCLWTGLSPPPPVASPPGAGLHMSQVLDALVTRSRHTGPQQLRPSCPGSQPDNQSDV